MSDTLPTTKATPAVAFCFLLNQLLERERWARDRLAPFEGKAAELRLPLLAPLRLRIAAGGRIEESAAHGNEEPSAVIMLNGIEGAGAFADELRHLAKHLRPDVEEELSKLIGDVAARRIGALVQGFARWQADAALRLSEALADYATDERRLLVRRIELEALAGGVERLAEALGRLEKRVSRLA